MPELLDPLEEAGKDRLRNPDGTFASTIQQPEAPPVDTYRQRMTDILTGHGFAESDIGGMTNPILGMMVAKLQQQQIESMKQVENFRLVNQPQQQPVTLREPAAAVEDDFPIDEEELHPSLVKSLKAIKAREATREKELAEIKKALKDRDDRDEQRQVITSADMLDEAFAALGDKYKSIVGDGSVFEIGETDKDSMSRRVAIIQAAGVNPKQVPPLSTLKKQIAKAAATLYPMAAKAAEPNPYADAAAVAARKPKAANGRISEEEWNNSALARPTHRQSDEPPGEARAVKNLAAKQRDMGIHVPTGEVSGFQP